MACRKYHHLLPLHMDPMLLSEQERLHLKNHLAECPECAREAEKYLAAADLVKRLGPVSVPADFHARLMRRISTEELQQRRTIFLWTPLAAGSVGAAALLLVLLVFQPLHKSDLPVSAQSTRNAPAVALSGGMINPGDAASASIRSRSSRMEKLMKQTFQDRLQEDNWQMAAAKFERAANFSRRTLEPSESAESLETAVLYPGRGLARPVSFPQSAALPAGGFSAAGTASYPAVTAETAYRDVTSEWSGEWCAIEAPENRLARNAAELRQFWERSKIHPVVTELGDGKQMLAGIFLGSRPGRGYEIHLTSVENRPNQLLIKYRVRNTGFTDAAGSQLSRPYLVVLLPYSELPVVFQEE